MDRLKYKHIISYIWSKNKDMNRKILKYLERWRSRPGRRPLLLRGARQVGKTWAVRQHGKGYQHFIECNLDERPEYARLVRDLYGTPDKLILALQNLTGVPAIPGKTLLFLDEIQETPEALKSLRYFKEKLPELHVIAAGSLLEFTIKEQSFPVGRVEFAHLFPLDFAEYLEAKGRGDLVEQISAMSHKNPPDHSTHAMLIEESAAYLLLGGMPEVVSAHIEGGSPLECEDILQVITATYREDFFKYASRAKVPYLRKILDNTPRLLGQKFKFSHIDREARSRELGQALSLMVDAGLVYKVFHTSADGIPIGAQEKQEKFKVFVVDVGICGRLLGLRLSDILHVEKKINHLVSGALAEQFVAQELISMTPPNHRPALHYWHREAKSSQAEIDFVVERDAQIIPIEVKSKVGGAMKSLHLFLSEKNAPYAIKISQAPWSIHGPIRNIPFYAMGQYLSQKV